MNRTVPVVFGLFAVSIAALLMTACSGGGGDGGGGESGPNPSPTNNPPIGIDAGGSKGDGSTSSSSGGNCTPGSSTPAPTDVAPATKYVGSITVLSSAPTAASKGSAGVLAGFMLTPTNPGVTILATDGACTLQEMTFSTSTNPTVFSAGALSVDVNGGNTFAVPAKNGVYTGGDDGFVFNDCDTIHAHATGDPAGAPAFDIRVKAPSRVTLDKLGNAGSLTQSRAEPLAITWTGGSGLAGIASLGVSTTSSTGPTTSVTRTVSCRVDANAGAATMPTSLLSQLPAGKGTFTAITGSVETLVQGDWTIVLSITAYAVNGSVGVTLQ